MLRPWGTEWIAAKTFEPAMPPPLQHYTQGWPHWSRLLRQAAEGKEAKLHMFTDGSWTEGLGIGGYAVAIVIVVDGASALFGTLSDQTHGAADCRWELAC